MRNTPYIDISFETQKKFLSAQNIVIIGGHPKWIKSMKAVYPDFIFFDCDNRNRDLQFLNRNDMKVFSQTAYIGHPMHERVKKKLKRNGNTLYNLNTRSTVRATAEMYQQLCPIDNHQLNTVYQAESRKIVFVKPKKPLSIRLRFISSLLRRMSKIFD